MARFKIYKKLKWLNELAEPDALAVFLACSGSAVWARLMTSARPFALVENLFSSAAAIWFSLDWADQAQAFIYDSRSAENELRTARNLYEQKFGFAFVAAANSDDELLAICRARFGNSIETERRIAAEEHLKKIESKLEELLER